MGALGASRNRAVSYRQNARRIPQARAAPVAIRIAAVLVLVRAADCGRRHSRRAVVRHRVFTSDIATAIGRIAATEKRHACARRGDVDVT